ncbi:MAG: lactate utilization protein [Candidatus Abyssobacteria bacterium SURF_17]|uniref:Lactate utilization protein n=1 Tax=Candidatus Abyssobacteria bacterium SURF_17 TaxID=2093361 RepID=A0A419F4X2_9BACT|nr:MAG: lactate utilization protein [Candidatus Abyssubacteria bacterium SURF_17]
MKVKTEQFTHVAEQELKNVRTRALLDYISSIIDARREEAMSSFSDPAAALAYGRAIRAEAIMRMPELLEEFEKKAAAHGAVVLWARDSKEANDIVLRLAKERGIRYVTKGKSMVTEEIGLNDVLKANGIEVFEADLGEFIAQLLERPPFHIVGPAINIPVDEICKIFLERGIMREPTTDPVALGAAARAFLRDKFHHLQMGITGVNMAVAETGTIINVENEGNIRFAKSSPRTQVSLMTLEKVVPTMNDAMHLLRLLCRNCTAQKISAYVSMDSGPKKADEIDGPEELFIIVIDNGRSRFYGDIQAREALRCIRCGACMYGCPVYMKIGGYPYGWAYSGPMGQVLNPLLLGLDKTQDLYRACTLCGKCKEICPSGIDHPKMFLSYRAKDVEGDEIYKGKRRSWKESAAVELLTWGIRRAWRWNLGAKATRPAINRYADDGKLKNIKGTFEGWFRSRDFPSMAERTFHERMDGRDSSETNHCRSEEEPTGKQCK